tara:strand:+ start:605 stop:793 length:189 start_codon:yes stop_codon:yes gene_type:complete
MFENSWTALKLFARAIGMPKPIERSPYELENFESFMAEAKRREMDSTSKEPSCREETTTTKS